MTSANRATVRRKGEPIWVMVVIISGWIGLRMISWESPQFAQQAVRPDKLVASTHAHLRKPDRQAASAPLDAGQPWPMVAQAAGMDNMPAVASGAPMIAPLPSPGAALGADQPLPSGEVAMAGGHQLMWMAAMARFPVPGRAKPAAVAAVEPMAGRAGGNDVAAGHGAMARLADPRAALLFGPSPAPQTARLARWSGDGWVLWREGGNGAPGAALRPSYGANQVGAVLRYRLATTSAYRPAAYVRGYGAMNGTGEREVAMGLSARPITRLPFSLMVEGRASRFMGGTTHLRPAVAVVSEMPPVTLPGKIRAETYVQAGYVGGVGSTPFVDGQFRLERVVDHTGAAELRVGAGAWGGAQKGAGRIDMGPTATLAFAAGRVGAHLSLDWRIRVGGQALPGSGPAITLAAGF